MIGKKKGLRLERLASLVLKKCFKTRKDWFWIDLRLVQYP